MQEKVYKISRLIHFPKYDQITNNFFVVLHIRAWTFQFPFLFIG